MNQKVEVGLDSHCQNYQHKVLESLINEESALGAPKEHVEGGEYRLEMSGLIEEESPSTMISKSAATMFSNPNIGKLSIKGLDSHVTKLTSQMNTFPSILK